jgi:hypothetical protein
VKMCSRLSSCRIGPIMGFCGYGDEPLGYGMQFDWITNLPLLRTEQIGRQ